MRHHLLESPIGPVLLVARGSALTRIHFHGDRHEPPAGSRPARDGVLATAADQLAAYFAAELRSFDLPLEPAGTPFQQAVWWALADIPYGETASYGELARRIDRPRAVRAVGAANGANPLPIVLPCHRVIGSDGSLTGFGGGLDVKRVLLELERGEQLQLPW